MSENTQLADLVKETGEKFSKAVAELRSEFEAQTKAGTADAADSKAKVESLSNEVGNTATSLQELTQKAEGEAKARVSLDAIVEELKRTGAPA